MSNIRIWRRVYHFGARTGSERMLAGAVRLPREQRHGGRRQRSNAGSPPGDIPVWPALLTDNGFGDILVSHGVWSRYPRRDDPSTSWKKEDEPMKKHVLAALAALALLTSPCLVPAAQQGSPAPAAKSAPAGEAAPAARESIGQELHGNPSSKVYHMPSCRYYNSKSASKVFKTAEEAGAAGYRPCKICGGKKGA